MGFSGHVIYFIFMSKELSEKDIKDNIEGLKNQYLALVSGYSEINTFDL